ncbi:MAG: XRE family transcriptional regulator [Catenulispora sp.]|nr:XRE family transcriptional regulator [Catenulispora sp.]NUT40026.1 XRE family transcriptional regulator [Thermoactinospora sp.]
MAASRERQEDLARTLRLSQGQISRKQSGASMWTLDDCDKLAAHYGITVAQLLSGPEAALDAATPKLRPLLLRVARRPQ